MSSDYSRTVVDPWSRFASYCSLVVALGALAWVYFGQSSLTGVALSDGDRATVLNHVDKLLTQEATTREQTFEELRTAWHTQQKEQLSTYKKAADGMLAEHHTLINQLASQVQPATFTSGLTESELDVDQSSSNPADNPSLPFTPAGDELEAKKIAESAFQDQDQEQDSQQQDASSPAEILIDEGESLTDSTAESQPIAEKDDAENAENVDDGKDELSFTPLLAEVRQTRKPDGTLSDTETGIVTIHNHGGGKAIVNRVEFIPSRGEDAVFAVGSSIVLDTSDDLETRSVVFSQQDNTAVEKGKHSVYARDFTDAFAIPADEEVRLRLAISNQKHKGWGFRGTVRVSYNGFKPLEIESAEIVFVDADTPIVKK